MKSQTILSPIISSLERLDIYLEFIVVQLVCHLFPVRLRKNEKQMDYKQKVPCHLFPTRGVLISSFIIGERDEIRLRKLRIISLLCMLCCCLLSSRDDCSYAVTYMCNKYW